ncbi:UNVERIFIED_CONTAM: TetR/AcrR family transcriptional regulator of autoinduction and epiphytic fitness [Brevibacillus sp. OAP136]
MRGNEQQTDPLHDARREQIKTAALKVFAEKGIAGAKMSMIAAEAGISQGLSYRYFSSKEELFTILVKEAMEEARSAFANVKRLPGTPKEQLTALSRTMLEADHAPFFLLLQQVQTSAEVPAEAKAIIEQNPPSEMMGQLLPLFIKGQQLGEFSPGDPERLLFLYFSVLTGLMLQAGQTVPGYWQQDVERLMKIILP